MKSGRPLLVSFSGDFKFNFFKDSKTIQILSHLN